MRCSDSFLVICSDGVLPCLAQMSCFDVLFEIMFRYHVIKSLSDVFMRCLVMLSCSDVLLRRLVQMFYSDVFFRISNGKLGIDIRKLEFQIWNS